MSNKQDWQLIAGYLNGRDRAFEDLLSKYKNMIYPFIMTRVRNTQVANDVFQESCFRLLRDAHGLKPSGSLKGWLFTTANNLSIDHLRKKKREGISASSTDDSPAYRAPESSMPDVRRYLICHGGQSP